MHQGAGAVTGVTRLLILGFLKAHRNLTRNQIVSAGNSSTPFWPAQDKRLMAIK